MIQISDVRRNVIEWLGGKIVRKLCHLRVKIMYCVCLSVRNYSIPTANSTVDGADTLTGAGILNFLNIYLQETPVNAPRLSVDNSQFWFWVSSVLRTRYLSKMSICRPNLYWPMLLVSCTIASWKRPTSKLPWQRTCRVGELA